MKHDQGKRIVRFHELQGPQWLPNYQRWSLRVGGHFLDERGEVSLFLNLGNCKDEPQVMRKSRYYRYWTLANGGPPRKGEAMDPEIFLDKCFLAVIQDSTLADTVGPNGKRELKHADEIYSHVNDLLELVHSPQTPLNHESRIKNQKSPQSSNQPIKVAIGEAIQVPPSPGGV